jgi:site-specific DNA recombinase
MATTQGAIYCRISKDAEGLALGVDRQRQDCLELARQQDIEVAPERILIENDTGASTRSRKPRPVYDQLKQMVADGEVQAVVFYSNSRLTRRPLELEDWITLHERTSVRLVSKVSGNDDLGTADGRMVARIKASVDAAEAERISERVKRTFEQRRADGHASTGGYRPFGFTSSRKDATIIPIEAECVRLGARILLAGGTYGEVAREWTRLDVKPVSAKTWQRDSIRGIYRSGRIAGLVTYQGEVVGAATGGGIIDRATWEAVQGAAEHAPARPPSVRRHVLSGFVYCGICGATMVVQGLAYKCVPQRQGCGGTRRDKAWLDAFVDGYVREKLAAAGPVEVGPATSTRGELIENLEKRIGALRARFEAEDSDLAPEDYFPSLTAMRGRVNELRKQEADSARRVAAATSTEPLAVWEQDDAAFLTARRNIVAGLISGIYVKPIGRIGRRPIPTDSVDILPA